MHYPDTVASTIALALDGKDYHLSTLLIRDLCKCKRCIHESTNQKLFSTTEIPPHIHARTVELLEEKQPHVRLSWENDVPGFDPTHQTILPVKDLLDVARLGAAPSAFNGSLGKHQTWGAQSYNVVNIDYEDYMQNDITLYQILRQLWSHGLLFVTNVPGAERSVSAIAERIGPVKETFYGYTWDGVLLICSRMQNRTEVLTRKSSHRSTGHQCCIYLRRPGFSHRRSIHSQSAPCSILALHAVVFSWRCKRFHGCFQVCSRPFRHR